MQKAFYRIFFKPNLQIKSVHQSIFEFNQETSNNTKYQQHSEYKICKTQTKTNNIRDKNKKVQTIPNHTLTKSKIVLLNYFTDKLKFYNMPLTSLPSFDIDYLIQKALKCQLLPEQAISLICHKLKDIFIQQKNVNYIQAPVTVVGDVHGQFYDVLEIFKIGGQLPYTSYLFLGDYVDRGAHSVEVITLLCLFKIKYPSQMNMIRGNHQTRAITQNYGFYMECQTKYGNTIVWEYFTDIFDYFPIAAIIDNQVFAVHGGLSPLIESVDQVQGLDRFQQIPHDGPLCDLMWSDPQDGETGFVISPRGAGYIFGSEVLKKFLHFNGLDHLTRAHQLCTQGYQLLFNDQLSTVWSAPNYIYRMGNMASIMELNQYCERYFNVFSQSPENITRGIGAMMAAGQSNGIKNQSQKYFM